MVDANEWDKESHVVTAKCSAKFEEPWRMQHSTLLSQVTPAHALAHT